MIVRHEDTIAKEVDVIQDQINISKKAKRKLFQHKVYQWIKSNMVLT